MLSAAEAQDSRSTQGRREMIDTSLATPSVSDWLVLLLRGGANQIIDTRGG